VLSILRHLTKPGDMIAVESLTHIQMANIAERLGLRLARIAVDEHGMVPESLEQTLKRESIRAVYCQPTIHCATGATMPEARRDAVAAIIAQHEVPLIEDDEHFGIMNEPLRAVCDRLPDLGVFVADLSRAFGLGWRISHLHVPPAMRRPIAQQLIGTVWMVPPLMAEIAARMIEDETRCTAMIDAHRAEIAARHVIADESLGQWLATSRSREAHHVWIELPKPWRAEQFVAAAIGAGVAVTPAEGFVADASASPNAIRICLGASRDRDTLRDALQRIASLLRGETIASRGLV